MIKLNKEDLALLKRIEAAFDTGIETDSDEDDVHPPKPPGK